MRLYVIHPREVFRGQDDHSLLQDVPHWVCPAAHHRFRIHHKNRLLDCPDLGRELDRFDFERLGYFGFGPGLDYLDFGLRPRLDYPDFGLLDY